MSGKKARHFHAGKLRKEIDGVEYVEVAESNGLVYVGRNGLLITRNHKKPWSGCVDKSTGYARVSVDDRYAYAHRVVFEVIVGPVPDGMELDHIDTDRVNNAIDNLRIVTRAENCRNPLTYERRLATLGKLIEAARRKWLTCRDQMLQTALRNVRKAQEKWETNPEQMREYLQRAVNANKVAVIGVNKHTGEMVGPFESLVAASEATGVHISDISSNVHGRLKSAGGYMWEGVDHV